MTLLKDTVVFGIATTTSSRSPALLEIVVVSVVAAAVSVWLADVTNATVALPIVFELYPCWYHEVAA